ncbi:MAG: hypothetical protein ACU0C9_03345 [Paracoccaceae bacterium]
METLYKSLARLFIRLAAMLYVSFPPSLRIVGDLLYERDIDINHEPIRFWRNSVHLLDLAMEY